MGQARERARSMQQAVTYLCFEEEPLPQRWSASVDAGRVGTSRLRCLVALREKSPSKLR